MRDACSRRAARGSRRRTRDRRKKRLRTRSVTRTASTVPAGRCRAPSDRAGSGRPHPSILVYRVAGGVGATGLTRSSDRPGGAAGGGVGSAGGLAGRGGAAGLGGAVPRLRLSCYG